MNPHLWSQTPLIYSSKLSQITGANVYLKLETLHPSYSFKYRGISHFIQKAKQIHGPSVHLVAASGGNAGVAAACAAESLGLRCSIFIPEGISTSTLEVLKIHGARVIVGGRFYAEALEAAKLLVSNESQAIIVPAYEDPIVWEGHSSMILEIREQLPVKPDAIFCSVGGAGLLGGIILGCKDVGWDDVSIGTVETNGCDCFYQSLSLNANRFNSVERKLPEGVSLVHDSTHGVYLAHLSSFSSKASGSLGASQPSGGVVKMALERTGRVLTHRVPDELSMEALIAFADNQKILVELSCATALVPAYHPTLFGKIMETVPRMNQEEAPVVVFIVCGGFKIDLVTMAEYQNDIAAIKTSIDEWIVKCDDGELFRIPIDRSR
ncbi:tryptophan synthase beta subunit-like PLP-dependent enzyme [Crepidotus variabilis]|uniref:L-serine ammonia-lyase n=1 Tax=Crepidotus variabilis TaxID=179855 RepID=A0A9P6ER81_9AGAR|nr:tryptophan synthase beta subunit-like PLP-dependent enzyme [Crepidotus variabilis]